MSEVHSFYSSHSTLSEEIFLIGCLKNQRRFVRMCLKFFETAILRQREGVFRNKQYGNRFVFATHEREPVPSFNKLRFCFCAQKVSCPISTVEGSSPLCWKSIFSISLKGGTLDAKWEMNERLWSCQKFADEISLGSGTTLGPLFFDGTLKRLKLNFWRINFSIHLYLSCRLFGALKRTVCAVDFLRTSEARIIFLWVWIFPSNRLHYTRW